MRTRKRVDNKGRKLPDGIIQRKDGSYQARFTHNGKRISIYDRNLAALKEKVITKKSEIQRGIYCDYSNITMNEWFEKWMKLYKKNKLKAATYNNYLKYYGWYISNSIGNVKVSKIRRTQVLEVYSELLYKRDPPIAGTTLKIVHQIVNSMLMQAMFNDIIVKNPVENLLREITVPERKKKEALTETERELFLNYIKDSKYYNLYYPIFLIGFLTGMRAGELTALTWSDVDFNDDTININKTLKYTRFITENNNYYLITTPKTFTSKRVIPMTKSVKKAFLQQKYNQESLQIESECTINGYRNFVFTTSNKYPYTPDGLNLEICRIVKTYNREEKRKASDENRTPVLMKNFSTHIMRHTFATRCFERGIEPKVVQAVLGHKRIDTTLNIYTDCTLELEKIKLDLLDNDDN